MTPQGRDQKAKEGGHVRIINKIKTVWIYYCCIFNKELQITSTCSPVSLTGYSYTLGFHQDYSLWEKYIIHFPICHGHDMVICHYDHDGPRWPYRVSDLQHKLSYSLTIFITHVVSENKIFEIPTIQTTQLAGSQDEFPNETKMTNNVECSSIWSNDYRAKDGNVKI